MEVRSDRTPQPDGNARRSRGRLLPARHGPAPPLVPLGGAQPRERDARRPGHRRPGRAAAPPLLAHRALRARERPLHALGGLRLRRAAPDPAPVLRGLRPHLRRPAPGRPRQSPTTPSACAPSAPTSPSPSPASSPRRRSRSATATANSPRSLPCRRGRATTARRRRPAPSAPPASPGPSRAPTASRSRSAPRTAGVSSSSSSITRRGSAVNTPSPGPPSTGTSTSRSPRPATCWRHASSSAARPAARPSRALQPRRGHPRRRRVRPRRPTLLLRGYPPNSFRGEKRGSRRPGVPLPAPGGRPRRRFGPLLPAAPPRGAFRGCRRGLDRRGVSRRRDCTRASAPRSASTSSSPMSYPLTVRLGIAAGLDEEGGCTRRSGSRCPRVAWARIRRHGRSTSDDGWGFDVARQITCDVLVIAMLHPAVSWNT